MSVPLFDIIYAPVTLAPPHRVQAVARNVAALDRVHALLWYLKDEYGLSLDPVTLFDLTNLDEHQGACGCELRLTVQMAKVAPLKRLRSGEKAAPIIDIGSDPCKKHTRLNGTLAAWKSDPRRPDTFDH